MNVKWDKLTKYRFLDDKGFPNPNLQNSFRDKIVILCVPTVPIVTLLCYTNLPTQCSDAEVALIISPKL